MFVVGETIAIENMSATVVYVHDYDIFIAQLDNNEYVELEYSSHDEYSLLYEDMENSLSLESSRARIDMYIRDNFSD